MQIRGREKILAIVVLSFVAVIVIVLSVQGAILKPAKDLRNQKVQLQVKLGRLKKEQDQYKIAEKEVQAAAQKMIHTHTDQANGVLGELLNQLIEQVELNPRQFTRSPVGPTRVGRGLAREVGWTVQGEGPLTKVVDLLYLLQSAEALHKLEGVRLSASSQPGVVKVGFRYLTLVLEPAPSSLGTNTMTEVAVAEFGTPERQLYEGIVVRDLFRPYVKRPENVPSTETTAVAENNTPPAFRPEILKVVSLSEWAGKSEIHLRNVETGSVAVYQPGDTIEEWTIMAVDYRPMPMPDSILDSESRVILKNTSGYWALEQGCTLAQLHQMNEEQLPSDLKHKEDLKNNDN